MDPRNSIYIVRLRIMLHFISQHTRKFRIHCVRQSIISSGPISRLKTSFNLIEKQKRPRSLKLLQRTSYLNTSYYLQVFFTYIVSNAHINNSILTDIMEQIVPMWIREFVIPGWDFSYDLFGNFGEISSARGIFYKDGISSWYHAVQNWHLGQQRILRCKQNRGYSTYFLP